MTRTDSITSIAANTTLTLRLDGQAAAVLTYDAPEAQAITLKVMAKDADLDPIVEIVDPEGRRLAYNDDYRGETTKTPLADLAATDAAFSGLPLSEAGRYLIRVNSFNGVSVGEVEVMLTVVDPFNAIISQQDDQTIIQVTLTRDSLYRYTFPATKGQTYTVTARDPRGVLDSVLTLRDASGEVIVRNDDHSDNDLTLNIFDARITDFTLAADGEYTLEVSEFTGRAGMLEIVITATP